MTLFLKRFLGILVLLVAASYLVAHSSVQPVAQGLAQQELAGDPSPRPLGGP